MERHPSVKELVDFNQKHSELFCRLQGQRKLWRSRHRLGLLVFQCMDGRIHMANATGMPLGIFQSYRSLGGHFELGWRNLYSTLMSDIGYHIENGNPCLAIITYHHSKSSHHLGCAGFNYETEAAMASAVNFKRQLESVFDSQVVCPVLVGFETDEEAITLHSARQATLNVAMMAESDLCCLPQEIEKMFDGKMPKAAKEVLAELLAGNFAHVSELRRKGRKVEDLAHCGNILALGRGLDWFYQPNKALIVGMFSNNTEEAIIKAAGIIRGNMESGRIKREDGFIMLASAAFRSEAGHEMAAAKVLARQELDFGRALLERELPDMVPMMVPLAIVTNLDTRRLSIVT